MVKEDEEEQEKYLLRLCVACEEEGKVQQATTLCKVRDYYLSLSLSKLEVEHQYTVQCTGVTQMLYLLFTLERN